MSERWVQTLGIEQGRWTAMLQSPDSCWWAVVDGGEVMLAPVGPAQCDVGLSSGEPFEITAFDGHGNQRRWVRGHDPVVAVAPQDKSLAAQLLLWGTAESMLDGWTVMVEPRIGRYPIPAEIPENQRAVLTMREVVSVGAHGNAGVTATVFMGFQPIGQGSAR